MNEDFNISEELKKLPASPGVYIMHGQNDEIIYIGKAIVLKNRVRQYFQSSKKKTAKILKMVSQITRFEYIITDSETEALVLECNLIKEHSPKYNTMLKDDKAYPFIRVTVEEAYPRIQFARQIKKDKSRYFGPYTSATAVKETIELLQKLFHIRSCNRKLPEQTGAERPCLNYHIHQCDAPCQGYISTEDYAKNVDKAIDFLNGHVDSVRKNIKKKMNDASENLEFEEAIKYRELLDAIEHVAQHQKITDTGSTNDRDVIACARDASDVVVQVFFVREGKMIGREHYHMQIPQDELEGDILESFIKQYYSGTPFVPSEILLGGEIEDVDGIEAWLSNKRGAKVAIKTPKKGDKEKLVELAARNAKLVLTQDKDKIKREEERTLGAMRELENYLGLKGLVRTESYDISNTSGFESVGSMVVYENGRPKKSDYRKFKIKWVQGINDYASMDEVLTRRFKRGIEGSEGFEKLPDIILMDGGRGQVNICEDVLMRLGLDIPVAGMVKDDHHRTRGLYYKNVEIPIDIHGECFKLITRIQDETHRFAIEFHKSLRGKAQTKSVLLDIPGIGDKRRRALMAGFKSMEDLKNATVEEISALPTMNMAAAKQVYDFLHENLALQNTKIKVD
ncbi:MAG: excinuclease ABC subunit UvrC [Lachnospiraceae bacterium]|nr:excinuclease ABC subunit UvrC [Lachnospiraceae bacterium]